MRTEQTARKNEDLQGSSNVKEIYADAYLPLATLSADMREAQYRFQVSELEEANARGRNICLFTINQLTHRVQIAAEKARSSAEELRDRQAKFDAQEQDKLDDAKRLAAAEWATKKISKRYLTCGSGGMVRELSWQDQVVADLEWALRMRESSKLNQACCRECIIEGRVQELKQAKVGKLEWWQTEEREQQKKLEQAGPGVASSPRVDTKQMKKEEGEISGPGVASSSRVDIKQMKKEKREQAGPGVASPPGVETRQMKKARSS